jgi:HrpA-like RNA helicase
MYYTAEPQEDYFDAAMVTVLQINQTKPVPGDILVFLTGQDEIENLAKLIHENAKALAGSSPPLKICTLYGALAAEQQLGVFESVSSYRFEFSWG